ncbi:hypothetical protein L484_005366 [Morus notabilis]|uniref:Subtilisin-like protease fibronectin type-III domain-containing protein n=1 Tax=Morus notabilis TaxID=981085 RepID=W9S5U7_9ROSA|nr:hypothetical protein L484_005366 [Morus notabilis]
MAGGVGTIMPGQVLNDVAYPLPLPATLISKEDIGKVLEYIRTSKILTPVILRNPKATILATEIWKDTVAPYAAPFSSRGPNRINPDILKPDLTAPGVNILAAWSPMASPTVYISLQKGHKNIQLLCRLRNIHVLPTRHRSRSQRQGRSPKLVPSSNQIRTHDHRFTHNFSQTPYLQNSKTKLSQQLFLPATIMDPNQDDDREFAYGSGLLNPVKAVDPGLVFDTSEEDYVKFLCKQGYNSTTVRTITEDHSVCKGEKRGRGWDLNYPSFALAIKDGDKIKGSFNRTVTNVGNPSSTYNATVAAPESLKVKVEPSVLSFGALGEKKSFKVKIEGPEISQVPIISGSITWRDGVHEVRTPIVVYTVIPSALSIDPFERRTRKTTPASSFITPRNDIFYKEY